MISKLRIKYLNDLAKGVPDGDINSEGLEDMVYVYYHRFINMYKSPARYDINFIDKELLGLACFSATEQLILDYLRKNDHSDHPPIHQDCHVVIHPKKRLRWRDQTGLGPLVFIKEIPTNSYDEHLQGSHHSPISSKVVPHLVTISNWGVSSLDRSYIFRPLRMSPTIVTLSSSFPCLTECHSVNLYWVVRSFMTSTCMEAVVSSRGVINCHYCLLISPHQCLVLPTTRVTCMINSSRWACLLMSPHQ